MSLLHRPMIYALDLLALLLAIFFTLVLMPQFIQGSVDFLMAYWAEYLNIQFLGIIKKICWALVISITFVSILVINSVIICSLFLRKMSGY